MSWDKEGLWSKCLGKEKHLQQNIESLIILSYPFSKSECSLFLVIHETPQSE